ncbi:MAG: nucleotide exchange factor GrpE [Candidatus Kaiserbacteria bacterium]|nr:nucleotide exchange factor GrpE [Candidatus Kaiserbacteria bacterium]
MTDNDVEVTEEESGATDAIAKLKKDLALCKKERKEYLDGWKRSKADALNEKKRQLQARNLERDSAKAQAVMALLPILDSVRLAKAQFSETSAQAGIDQIYTQCLRSFDDLSVSIIDPIGDPFDPHRHQSLGGREVSSGKEENAVVEVAQVGALMGDQVVRAAMVYVGTKKGAGEEKG